MIPNLIRKAVLTGLLLACSSQMLTQAYCLYLPPGGAYRHGFHRVGVGQSFANTPSLEEFVWLDDGRVAAGYSGYSSFYPKRGVIRVFSRVSTTVLYQDAIEPPDNANDFSRFGTRIAASGDWIASPLKLEDDTDAVAVYEATGGSWTFRGLLQADEPQADDEFGAELAMGGVWMAIVDYGSPGGIYMFKRNAEGQYIKQQLLDLPGFTGTLPQRNLDLDLEENRLAIGQGTSSTISNFRGRVLTWTRSGDVWTFEQTITAPDAQPGDRVGSSIDLHGDLIVAGAPEADTIAANYGAVYLFRRGANGWQFDTKITERSPEYSTFGVSVNYSEPGPFLGISSLNQYHLYTLENNQWVQIGSNGGGDAFPRWESPAGTVRDYIVGRTNARPFFPTQRGNQAVVDFDGRINLLEYGLHKVRTVHKTNSVSDCVFEPAGYVANGQGYPGSADSDNDSKSDLEEAYHGTLFDTANELEAGFTASKTQSGGLSVQWPHLPNPEEAIEAVPQWSTDLENWSSEGITVQKIGEEPGTGREILQAVLPQPPEGLVFFRLQYAFAEE